MADFQTVPSAETHEVRLKRLSMRSWRRGMKEMDIVLGNYADHNLQDLTQDDLDVYENLLEQNDQDIHSWVIEQAPVPTEFAEIIGKIKSFFLQSLR